MYFLLKNGDFPASYVSLIIGYLSFNVVFSHVFLWNKKTRTSVRASKLQLSRMRLDWLDTGVWGLNFDVYFLHKTNTDTKPKMMVWKNVWILSNMAILSSYVRFQGCISHHYSFGVYCPKSFAHASL